MSEGDAEWIDLDNGFAPRTRGTTLRPRVTTPRPNNVTPRPRPQPRPRPRPRPGRPRPRDAPERVPPSEAASSNNATTISVSVVSAIFLLALVSLLLYLFVLKKKLRKVQQRNTDAQYSLRVEDVSHLDVDDSAKLYVNTTDLQKLVASVRLKNKKLPPPLPDFDYPDVVQVGRPPLALPNNAESKTIPTSPADESSEPSLYSNIGFSNLAHSNSSEIVYNNPSEESRPPSIISRPAPPIPTLSRDRNESRASDDYSENTVTQPKISKPPPPFLPKPVLPSSHMIQVNSDSQTNSKQKPAPPVASKPKPTPRAHPLKANPIPPTSQAKPLLPANIPPTSQAKPLLPANIIPPTSQAKPLLPRLKMNLRPPVKGPDSGFSTPDTAISYVNDTETPLETPAIIPEAMSIKARKAMLEGVLANVHAS